MQKFKPIKLLESNPHYFEFRGKPTILLTSAEHYSSVFNRDFDYIKYLDTLKACGFNHTRTSTGMKRELPGTFNIDGNSQAPAPEAYVSPWVRTDVPGCLDGANKYDLNTWNQEYFDRWHDFMTAASDRGVEVELMFFSEFHVHAVGSALWDVCPVNPENNINNLAPVDDPMKALSMENVDGNKYFDALIRRLVTELNGYDNLHYEICNEPYYDGVPKDWMQHVVDVIVDAEKDLENKHLISQNMQANLYEFEEDELLKGISIINFHYTSSDNYRRNYWFPGVLGMNETGILTTKQYHRQAWDNILGGAALYNMLDYSYTVGHEDGSYKILPSSPGDGTPELRAKLTVLANFINSFDFAKMHPATDLIKSVMEQNATYIMLAEEGKQYAAYFIINAHSGQTAKCRGKIVMPQGKYEVIWINAENGDVYSKSTVEHPGGRWAFDSGDLGEAINRNRECELALSIKRV